MTGAEAILRTGAAAGIRHCFCNPGSTELELLVAFDVVDAIRPVLGLHENVCTGMADGYGRIAERPAFTLLHQGSGLSNGSANLHNARKASSPIVNLVGTNASRDVDDTPLASDVVALGTPVSHWCKRATSARSVGSDVAAAIHAASMPPGQVATLVLPANVQSGIGGEVGTVPSAPRPAVAASAIEHVARALAERREAAALLLHSSVLTPRGLDAAGRIAAATGCALFAEPIPRRWERGAGLPVVRTIPCLFPPAALQTLAPFRVLVSIGSRAPQPYFLLEDTPAPLVPPGTELDHLAAADHDLVRAIEDLASALDAHAPAAVAATVRPLVPSGALSASAINAVVGALLPANAIVVQTSTTGARDFLALTEGAAPHTLLMNTGASVGWGMPAAAGAALAAPDRPVISLAADGGDVFAIQALWTQAREGLDVTTIVFANREYKILDNELRRQTPDAGPRARSLLSLREPDLDFCQLARGFGVPATRPESVEALYADLERALREPGPHLIEVLV